MGHDKRSNKHFAEKKLHTQIKHAIFSDTLKTSLSIANNLAIKDSQRQAAIYTYVDLFAGRGMFDDETEGSPLLALTMFDIHMREETINNNFSDIQLVICEKDEEDLNLLKAEMDRRMEKIQFNDKLKPYYGSTWEENSAAIQNLLASSKWGFIFADPFSTELEVDSLIQTINRYKQFKDILIFANFNTLSRQVQRRHSGDMQRVSRALGVTPQRLEQLLSENDFSDLFKEILRDRFSELKQIIIGVAIPVTVDDKLITADYFYLLFATDSIKVADGFLDAYENQVANYKVESVQQSLLSDYLSDEIVKFLDHMEPHNISLYKIISYLFNNFLSWKEAIKDIHYKVPTIRNIITCLNNLRTNRTAIISSKGDFFYKKNTAYGKKGDLAYTKLKSGKDIRSITVGLKR